MTGSIVLTTHQGLSYLAKDFYDNGIIDLVAVHHHTSRQNHYDWYPNRVSVEELLDKCDTLLFFETCFSATILTEAKKRGIKTILMVMYECTPPTITKMVDEIWSPSLLDKKYYPTSKVVKVPVNVKWKLRSKARVFVHNAGNGGLGGRNGTKELIEAFKHVKSDAKLILRSQIPIKCDNPKIDVRIGQFDDIWNEGDVFVFPEKFNGLSLPLQEAFASGMMVMAGDRFPMNTWLPSEVLIPVVGYHKEKISLEFDCAEYNPKDIAKLIDRWYNCDISAFSLLGKEFNEIHSWKNQKEKLKELMSQ